MCQPTTTITAKVEELMNLRKAAEELQNQMETITDEIKAYMGNEETMMAGSYKVTWKETVERSCSPQPSRSAPMRKIR